MKHLPLFLLLNSTLFAAELSESKQKVLALAAQNQIELRIDQSYADNDNPKQRVDLYLPGKRNSSKPLPVVAFIHGGGWVNGDRLDYAAAAIQLARTGDYAAVTVGYRLTKEAHWPEQIYDCKAAIRWIRGHAQELNLDADRIAVWGSSAGGHLSSLLGTSGGVKALEGRIGPFTSLSSRVAGVVNLCGPEDFTKALMFDKTGNPIIQDDAVIGLLGGNYEEQHDAAVAASPLTYVSADDPPFITFHGTTDQRVAFLHAEAIHAALKKTGVPSLLVPITGGGHGSVSHPEVKKRGEQFTARHLRGIATEIDVTPIPALSETITLFTGPELSGFKKPFGTWQSAQSLTLDPANAKAFQLTPGTGIFVNSAAGKTNDLFSLAEHGDCELHVEFCVPQGSNSGVYLMGRYEVQILDSFGKKELKFSDCGGLYQSHLPAPAFTGKPPAVNASKAPGEWQSFDITFRAPRFDAGGTKTENARFIKVLHNGQLLHENVEVNAPTRSAAFNDEKPLGPLKIQGDHGPVAFRNLTLKKL
jgi:acetyl esterase/lipase